MNTLTTNLILIKQKLSYIKEDNILHFVLPQWPAKLDNPNLTQFKFIQKLDFIFLGLRPFMGTIMLMIVPTPLEGEELYTQMGFFVQTILTDRYTHCPEL